MKVWKRYLSAWSRHHRSGGFGIHSPFAFSFVREVLRQRKSYYAYAGLHTLHATIKAGTTRRQRREMDLIAERDARLLFRVTNFFNPRHFLQVGAATGVESVAMLEVSHGSRLYLYDSALDGNALAVRVLQSQSGRVECYDDIEVAAGDFLSGNEGYGSLMALINTPVEEPLLQRLLDTGTVTVLRNLNHEERMWELFDSCCSHMTFGQTFTNGKTAILLPNPKLQREDFLLWL